jgi:hypothetical protein
MVCRTNGSRATSLPAVQSPASNRAGGFPSVWSQCCRRRESVNDLLPQLRLELQLNPVDPDLRSLTDHRTFGLRRRRPRHRFVLVILVIFMFLGRAADTLIPVVALPLALNHLPDVGPQLLDQQSYLDGHDSRHRLLSMTRSLSSKTSFVGEHGESIKGHAQQRW